MDDRREKKGEQHDVIRMTIYVFSYTNILLGVLFIGVKANNRWLMIHKSVMRKKRGK
jgi:hypothetical protein